MKQKICVKAPAKLNFALDIVGTDERGYHLLQMIMQTIDLYDEITVTRKTEEGISLSCNLDYIPCNEKNICYRCAEVFFNATGITDRKIAIHMEKQIPQQAGMAGGSADGAGTLVALNRLYETNLPLDALCEIGAKIGADIPFCLVGGTAKVEGIGEKIKKIADFPDCVLVVAKPKGGISTQKAFADFDQKQIAPKLNLEQMITAIERGNLHEICKELYNALERVCTLEEVFQLKNTMMGMGAKGALMTGSGSAVFGIFPDAKRAYDCECRLRTKYKDCFLCHPVTAGPMIVQER